MHEGDTAQQASRMALGRYQLLQVIGQGGMGEVWLAEDPRLKRRVAIKTLPPHSQRDSEYSLRFEREARAAAALNHPHILPVHDYGEQALPNGQLITYIVMPYVSGGTLADRITRLEQAHTIMPVSEALTYLTQAAEAIDYAHQRHVLHRDIKPNNMLLRDANWLLLADFGIARILSEREESLTQTGRGFGTPEYMAPEQARGRAEGASDNYSLAVIAYQLLTGRLPFIADTDYATMIQHMLTPPPPPRQVNPTLPLRVEQALLQGLAKDPTQRPASARTLVTDLQQALAGASLDATLIRHTSSPLGIAASTDYGTHNDQRTELAPPTFPDNGKLTSPGTHTGITRRQALVGGTALIVAAGGLGTWAIASGLHASPQPQTSKPRPKPTSNPNAPIVLLAHNRPISALAWSPLSNTLASAAQDNQVMLWNSGGQMTQPAAKSQLDAATNTSLRLAWSPKADMVAIGDAGFDTKTFDAKIYVYRSDLSGFAPGYTNQFTVPGTLSIGALCWAPGPYLIAGYEASSKDFKKTYLVLELWDPAQPQQGLPFIQKEDFFHGMASSPDGSLLAISTLNSTIIGRPMKVGTKAHWQQLAVLKNDLLYTDTIDSISWSPDGRYLAGTSNSDIITIWDWQHSPTKPYKLLPQVDTNLKLMSVAWSPSRAHSLLAARNRDGTVYVLRNINPRAGIRESVEPTRTLAGKPSVKDYAADYPLAWSADGQWLASGYGDTNDTILVWKV